MERLICLKPACTVPISSLLLSLGYIELLYPLQRLHYPLHFVVRRLTLVPAHRGHLVTWILTVSWSSRQCLTWSNGINLWCLSWQWEAHSTSCLSPQLQPGSEIATRNIGCSGLWNWEHNQKHIPRSITCHEVKLFHLGSMIVAIYKEVGFLSIIFEFHSLSW